jgi:dipeptidyl aminopeptidase/acylaminoacyl peptidase
LPDGTPIYAAYRDGTYELCRPDGRLTDAEGDITDPRWLSGRETILALRDHQGSEQHNLVEIDPETGALSPILDDEFFNQEPQQNPTDPDLLAFVSNRHGSLDLYTVDIEREEVTRRSQVEETVGGYAWAPDGEQLVYQAGLNDDTALRLIDLAAGTDEVLVDEQDSEQSFSSDDVIGGHDAWSTAGIVFTTNHETGYRELAVADADGDYDLRHVTRTDKYEPRWTADGDIVFVEPRGGDRTIRRLSDGEERVVEDSGENRAIVTHEGSVDYTHHSPATAGDFRRDGEAVVREGAVDIGTVWPEEVTVEASDGREIAARHYVPDGEPIGGVVQVHGGPEAQHFTGQNFLAQTLAGAGFEVLAPDYRGSIGYGREFRQAIYGDMGGPELTDVVASAEYLREHGRSRVAVAGASYGGYLTLMAAGKTDAFDAGVSACGIVNWETALQNSRGFLADYLMRMMGGTPDDVPEMYAERSPITYVEDIEVPLLVVQGANDPRVPQSEAEQLVASLEERDVPHEYLLFEDEGHGITRTANRMEFCRRTVSFLDAQF